MSFLELRHVAKIYGEGPTQVQALQDVSMSVEAGELVAVMGPSGSGKSSLLTIAGSLEEPTSGYVLVGGATLSKLSRAEKARLRRRTIGYVFQDFNLLPGLTAVENVSLPLELDGLTARKARAVGIEALDELELTEQAERFPDELSGGERQRVAIARAVAGCPLVVLADEPTGNLDSHTAAAIIDLLTETREMRHDRPMTVIIATHDPQIAARCERMIRLKDGVIVDDIQLGDGDPADEAIRRAGQLG